MAKRGIIGIVAILIIIIIFVIFGFKIASKIPERTAACTEMYCDCENNLNGEMPCNSCGVEDPIFLSGIFNVYRYCDAREIVVCQNEERTTRIDKNEESCKLDYRFFEFAVRID